MEDDVIGIVTIKNNDHAAFRSGNNGKAHYSHMNTCSVIHFDKECMKVLNCERVTFDRNNLIVNEGTICDNKTFKLSHGTISLALSNREELAGEYEMVKERKGYKLYKIQ